MPRSQSEGASTDTAAMAHLSQITVLQPKLVVCCRLRSCKTRRKICTCETTACESKDSILELCQAIPELVPSIWFVDSGSQLSQPDDRVSDSFAAERDRRLIQRNQYKTKAQNEKNTITPPQNIHLSCFALRSTIRIVSPLTPRVLATL